ncbi:adenine nucleotide alpha hydrolase [Parvibaculum sp.]|uniref:adenine nucleotide alpha hydrolase n=1 Tax=Parvibaculum sp. TaxID=2024848 RepID=UPI001B0DB1C5|nr:adenine nucleotide alpha hydrolase [Parvibaculum sp.]MBO6636181.1 adenine nucleotide alpha hydrolase [Parvibaculum sp.]MBO6679258.1 adenine nucleotide alpha hydrolase [Parvibaculum sp.]MBO6685566.1 adenine nucleotide alpha hydrolase [Parvibaculum sp.]
MTTPKPKAILSWSSGKDAAFALHEMRRTGAAEIVGLLTTVNETHERVAMHGVRERLLDLQAEAAGLPLIKVPIPFPCPNEIYEERMAAATARMKADGIAHVVFGDLFLEDIRAYREARLKAAGMTGLFPLWGRKTDELARDMIDSGLVAHLACVDPKQVPAELSGRRFDRDLLAALPEKADPCGENGEFHTVVTAGPMFARAIDVEIGETVTRDGFVYTDVIPV